MVRDFSTYSKRDCGKLVRQAGDALDIDVLDDTWQFYDNSNKGQASLERLDKSCVPFNKQVHRTNAKSIY